MATKKGEKKDKLIIIGIIVLAIIFIFIIYKIFNIIVKKNEEIDLSGNNYYQYFYGIFEEYSGKMEIVKHNNIKKLYLEDGRQVTLDSTPIYYKDILGKVILPEKMAVVFPKEAKINRLNEFTNIIQDSNVMYAKKLKKDDIKPLYNAFLFDGDDLYFFLEETTIIIGKTKYTVSPLSYAIVNYRQNIEIYDYIKDEYTIIEESVATSSSDVKATPKSKDYTINMSVDSFSTGSTDQLLLKSIDNAKEFDY